MGRGFIWQLRNIELTDKEIKAIQDRNPCDNEIVHKYLVWRKSSLLMAGIVLSLTALLSLVGLAFEPWELYNGLGLLATLSLILSPVVLAIAAWVAFFFWLRKPFTSMRSLSYGWLASLVMALWPLIIPLEYFIAGGIDLGIDDDQVEPLAQFWTRAYLALHVVIAVFPVIVTVPSGIIRGSLRVRGLLPECSLAGWLIVITSPLYPLIVLMAVVLVSQLLGNYLLVAGAVFFMAAPSLYVFRSKLYTKPKLSDQEISQVNLNQRIIGGLTTVGLILIAVWCLADTTLEITIWDVVNFLLSFFGNLFCNTVVFADVVFRMTVDSLSEDRIANENTVLGDTHALLLQLEDDFHEMRDGSNNNATRSVNQLDTVTSHDMHQQANPGANDGSNSSSQPVHDTELGPKTRTYSANKAMLHTTSQEATPVTQQGIASGQTYNTSYTPLSAGTVGNRALSGGTNSGPTKIAFSPRDPSIVVVGETVTEHNTTTSSGNNKSNTSILRFPTKGRQLDP
jgi:hypothetical protein